MVALALPSPADTPHPATALRPAASLNPTAVLPALLGFLPAVLPPAVPHPAVASTPSARTPSVLSAASPHSPLASPPPASAPSPRSAEPPPPPPELVYHITTRLQDGTIPRRVLTTDHTFALSASADIPIKPTCYSQASRDPQWRAAMAAEYDALMHNGTWDLVPPPSHARPIGGKWIYKIKLRANGSIENYKARLVAKGFHQQAGIDYTETFSPVAKAVTIRAVLAIAYSYGWSIRQLDVSNAFLHGYLSEEVNMTQPQGFVHPELPHHICCLRRSLYGLKQAPRAWYQCLSTYLLQLGFQVSSADTSLFILHAATYSIFLLMYVDDIVLTGSLRAPLSALLNHLQREFALKDLGPLHYFLGMEVQDTPTGLFLTQTKFAQDILSRTKMTAARPAPTPYTPNEPLSVHTGDPLPDPLLYRSTVGALQYLTLTRPDIAYSFNTACQFLHAPTTAHRQAVKRILRYLVDTSRHGLLFTRNSSTAIHAYLDAGWAGDRDDRRFVGGFCIFLGSNLISWSSRKQRTVARFSTEAEYKSLADTTAELIWIEFLLRDLHALPPRPPTL